MQHVQNLLKSMNLRPGTFFASSRLPSPLGRPELVICIWKFCPGKPGSKQSATYHPVYPVYYLVLSFFVQNGEYFTRLFRRRSPSPSARHAVLPTAWAVDSPRTENQGGLSLLRSG